MKAPRSALVVLCVLMIPGTLQAATLEKLKILYVGQPTNSLRARQYADFLGTNVAKFAATDRKSFQPNEASSFDVVLLDWPQAGSATEQERQRPCPLGARANWSKPTVLLGSAGLNIAVVWKVRGGAGCTCLQPFAYNVRDHQVFRRPFPIDTQSMMVLKTPPAFRSTITNATVRMLPLVRGHGSNWPPGWCTYPDGFDNNPDIEVFCGGENEKQAAAAACWRQGNLLHFGFEQSPAEMNDAGRRLLLNCIAYISRFTEDRPIAVTPSVFGGPAALPRVYLDRRIREKVDVADLEWIVSPGLLKLLKNKSVAEVQEWYGLNRGYLHPSAEGKLEIDKEAQAFGTPIDGLEFFDKAIEALEHGGGEGKRAAALLAGYAPLDAPMKPDPAVWKVWMRENRSYLFFSDEGDYGWYIDPLAKKRGIPCAQLRGPARASLRDTAAD